MEAIMTIPSVIDANGEISLGKQYAGQQVLVEEQELGVWLVRLVELNHPKADIQNALAWAQDNPPSDTNVDALLEKLKDG